MRYIRKSSQLISMGGILSLIAAAPFLWLLTLTPETTPAWVSDVETFKRVGQIFGGMLGVSLFILLLGLLRRIFSKKDKQDLLLVNFILRFGFVFLMFAALILGGIYMFQTLTPEMMPYIEPYQSTATMVGYGLAVFGIILVVLGFTQKKPVYPETAD